MSLVKPAVGVSFSHGTLTFIFGMLWYHTVTHARNVASSSRRAWFVLQRFTSTLKLSFYDFSPLYNLFDIYLLCMKAACEQISDTTGQKCALAAVSRYQSPTCCHNRCEMKACFWANKPLNLRHLANIGRLHLYSRQTLGFKQKLVDIYSQAVLDIITMND